MSSSLKSTHRTYLKRNLAAASQIALFISLCDIINFRRVYLWENTWTCSGRGWQRYLYGHKSTSCSLENEEYTYKTHSSCARVCKNMLTTFYFSSYSTFTGKGSKKKLIGLTSFTHFKVHSLHSSNRTQIKRSAEMLTFNPIKFTRRKRLIIKQIRSFCNNSYEWCCPFIQKTNP